jgi:hypothetical protein
MEHIFDDQIGINEVSYDRKFCQILRAGIEDAQVVLLLALLPNIREIFMRGGPDDLNTLTWRASHNFESLRDLTVCGPDTLIWPLSFFNDLLRTTRKLETLQCCIGSSWYRTLTEIEPDPSHILPVNIQPHSLNCMRTLELKYCCLTASDLRGLIAACPRLESFCYHVATSSEGVPGPSSTAIIEILEPLKNTLKDLYLDVPLVDNEDRRVQEIRSLTHMKTLEILDTAATMWLDIINEDFALDEYDSDDSNASLSARCLYSRLPTSIQKLIFHETQNSEETEPALSQMIDLVRMQPEVLPKLVEVVIETSDEDYIEELSEIITTVQESQAGDNVQLVKVNFGPGPASIFDSVIPSIGLPDTKWFGNKYSVRHRKPGKIHQATKMLGEAWEEAANITDALAGDPELEGYFVSFSLGSQEPDGYYDSGEEPPTPVPWE